MAASLNPWSFAIRMETIFEVDSRNRVSCIRFSMPAVSWYGIRMVCIAFLKVETLLDQLGTQFGGTTSDIVSR